MEYRNLNQSDYYDRLRDFLSKKPLEIGFRVMGHFLQDKVLFLLQGILWKSLVEFLGFLYKLILFLIR